MASYDKYVPYALQMERDTGIPAAIILGQAMLEGGSSLNSGLVRNANNFFGIKGTGNAGSVYMPTKEQDKNGRVHWENAKFKKYKTPYDSFMDHAALLQKPLYQGYLKNAKTLSDWVQGIHKSPYATDAAYDTKLMGIIKSNGLDKIGSVPVGYMDKIGSNPAGGTDGAINTGFKDDLKDTSLTVAKGFMKMIILLVLFIVGVLFFMSSMPVEKAPAEIAKQAGRLIKPVKAAGKAAKAVKKVVS
jgi:hypothetical protein